MLHTRLGWVVTVVATLAVVHSGNAQTTALNCSVPDPEVCAVVFDISECNFTALNASCPNFCNCPATCFGVPDSGTCAAFADDCDNAGVLELCPATCDNCGTAAPTAQPTTQSNAPTEAPTRNPTTSPTGTPTNSPTNNPTNSPTNQPTRTPTHQPTAQPTQSPTTAPTLAQGSRQAGIGASDDSDWRWYLLLGLIIFAVIFLFCLALAALFWWRSRQDKEGESDEDSVENVVFSPTFLREEAPSRPIVLRRSREPSPPPTPVTYIDDPAPVEEGVVLDNPWYGSMRGTQEYEDDEYEYDYR
eukprot:m.126449 g.126449  ORF g.126449 m.126449 type:complete len:302 (-) comp22189_c0_seq2:88-993(-)